MIIIFVMLETDARAALGQTFLMLLDLFCDYKQG
jgi:hypothetical protein